MVPKNEMDAFVEGLRQEFLQEANFLLEKCEESFLKLDDPSLRRDELAQIFRAAHTVKGSGAAVGFDDLATFAHSVEDCLSLLRSRPDHLTTDIVSLLLRANDALRSRVASHMSNAAAAWDIEDLVLELKGCAETLRAIAAFGPDPSVQTPVASESPGFEIFADNDPSPPGAAAVTPLIGQSDTKPIAAQDGAAGNAAKKSSAGNSVKVDVQRIDCVLDLVGELVVLKSQLLTQAAPYSDNLQLATVVGQLDKSRPEPKRPASACSAQCSREPLARQSAAASLAQRFATIGPRSD